MLITTEEDDRHFTSNHQNDDVGGDGDQRISINVKVNDRLKKDGSLLKLRDSASAVEAGNGGLILPISATIVMRSNGGVSNQRKKKIRESSSRFRALFGMKFRRRISREGFVPVVSVVFAFVLFIFVVISVHAPSPVRQLRFCCNS